MDYDKMIEEMDKFLKMDPHPQLVFIARNPQLAVRFIWVLEAQKRSYEEALNLIQEEKTK